MTISEKVAYLKGLAEGLDLDPEKSKEAKLISVMIGILEDLAISVEDLEDTAATLGDGLDAVSDDLADVEKLLYGDEDDEDLDDVHDFYDDEDDFFEVECPSCGAEIDIDSSILEAGQVECPGCGDKFAIDLSDEEDETED